MANAIKSALALLPIIFGLFDDIVRTAIYDRRDSQGDDAEFGNRSMQAQSRRSRN